MGLVVTDRVGLIIALCNVVTFVFLVYLFLEYVAGERSRLYVVIDKIISPALFPLRKVTRWKGFDLAPLIVALILQLVVVVLRWKV